MRDVLLTVSFAPIIRPSRDVIADVIYSDDLTRHVTPCFGTQAAVINGARLNVTMQLSVTGAPL